MKEIRHVFNEGGKLSAMQFAHLLGETRDRIANYESGRTGIPAKLLYELYKRGINPVYIVAGKGSMFAENESGRLLRERFEERKQSAGLGDVKIVSLPEGGGAIDPKYSRPRIYTAAAGEIKRKKKKDANGENKS